MVASSSTVDPGGSTMTAGRPFSDELEQWLRSDGRKTVEGLQEVFAEKSFAVAIVLLMAAASTPVPTGGLTLVSQLVAAVVACELVIGRREIWMPRRWRQRELGRFATDRLLPFVVRRVRWFERHSHARGAALLRRRPFLRAVGVVLVVFAVTAALAPPLSGLEVLPATGAVVIGLGMILEDLVVLAVGVLIGAGGVALFVSVGALIAHFVQRLL